MNEQKGRLLMSKYTFHKDPERKQSKEIKATEISEHETTFDLSSFSKEESSASDSGSKRIGRPAKNKVYSTIRIQKSNINRINAFQNTLDFETQDDIVSFMLDRLDNTLEPEQRTMFEMYMKAYESRDKKKQK